MDFACSAAVPFNGSNKEYAHHLLNLCNGNVKVIAADYIITVCICNLTFAKCHLFF